MTNLGFPDDTELITTVLEASRKLEAMEEKLREQRLSGLELVDAERRKLLPRGKELTDAILPVLGDRLSDHLEWLENPHRTKIDHLGEDARLPYGCTVRCTDDEHPVLILELPQVFHVRQRGRGNLWGWREDEAEAIRRALVPEFADAIADEWNGPPGNEGTTKDEDGEGAYTWSLKLEVTGRTELAPPHGQQEHPWQALEGHHAALVGTL